MVLYISMWTFVSAGGTGAGSYFKTTSTSIIIVNIINKAYATVTNLPLLALLVGVTYCLLYSMIIIITT